MAAKLEPRRAPGSEGVATLLKNSVDAIGHLLAGHLKLARIELVEDAKAMGRPAVSIAVCGVLALVGYVLVMVGVAAALRPLIGGPPAFLLLGGLHLAGGAIGAWLAVRRLRAVKVLDDSSQEASDSVVTLGTAAGEAPLPTEMEKPRGEGRRPELPEPPEPPEPENPHDRSSAG